MASKALAAARRRSNRQAPSAAAALNQTAAHFNKPLPSKSTDSVGISGSSIKGTQSDPSQNPAARTAISARQVPHAIRCQRDEPSVAWATNRAAAGVAGNQ